MEREKQILIDECANKVSINDLPYEYIKRTITELVELCEGKADLTSEKDLRVCEVSNNNFTFTVSDDYCTYSYPLNINSHNSVDEVATKIFKAFKLKKENGKFVKLEDRLVK
jgi:hypothetical protein